MATSGKLEITSVFDPPLCPPGGTVKVSTVLTLDAGSDDLAAGTWVEIDSGINFDISGAARRTYTPHGTPKVYSADFYINLSAALRKNEKVQVSVRTNAIGANNTAAKVISVGDPVNVTYQADASSFYFTSEDEKETPGTVAYAHYRAIVTKQDGTPVGDGFIVEWKQFYDVELFSSVNSYASDTAKYADRLLPDPQQGQGQVVRTVTGGSTGTTDLYLVPITRPVLYQVVGSATTGNTFQFGSVMIFNEKGNDGGKLPDFVCPREGGAGPFNLDEVQGNFVPVGIDRSGAFYNDPTRVLIFLNGKNCATNDSYAGDHSPIYQNVPKALISVSTPDEEGDLNVLYYVAGRQSDGNIIKSASNTFFAEGSRGVNVPDPSLERPLDPPTVQFAGDTVNLNTISDGSLHVYVPLYPSLDWAPAAGDTVTVTIYLNGYEPNTENLKQNSYNSQNTLTAQQITAGSVTVDFERAKVLGYDRLNEGQKGFYAEYSVKRAGMSAEIYSAYVNLYLSTPEGFNLA